MVLPDAVSQAQHNADTNLVWTHSPVGTPKGVVVFVIEDQTATPAVTGVTYGGVPLSPVEGSPFVLNAEESSVVHAYFLGKDVPSGQQTVEVAVSGTRIRLATATTVTANVDTYISAIARIDPINNPTDQDPVGTLSLNGVESFVLQGFWTGIGNPSSIFALPGWVSDVAVLVDLGGTCAGSNSYGTAESGNVQFGLDTTGLDEFNIVALGIAEVAGAPVIEVGLVEDSSAALAVSVVKVGAIDTAEELDATHSLVVNGSTVFLDAAHGRELRNHLNEPWSNVSGWSYAWYDDPDVFLDPAGPGAPAAVGTFDLNELGETRLEIPGTTLAAGQEGLIVIRHPDWPATPIMEVRSVPIGP